MFDLSGISWIAVIVAIVANMILGFLWFGPLLGKRWMEAAGKTEADAADANATMYVVPVLATLVLAIVLNNVMSAMGLSGLAGGLSAGFGAWLGFVALTSLTNSIFRDGHTRLWVLEAGNHLVGFLLTGAALGLF